MALGTVQGTRNGSSQARPKKAAILSPKMQAGGDSILEEEEILDEMITQKALLEQ